MKINKLFVVTLVTLLGAPSAYGAIYNTENDTVVGDVYTNGVTTYTENSVVADSSGNSYMSYNSTGFDTTQNDGVIRGDNLIASTVIHPNNEVNEAQFISDVTGIATSGFSYRHDYLFEVEDLGNGVFGLDLDTDDDGNVDFSYPSGGYYLLKFGSGETHWLFENSSSSLNFTWLAAIQPNHDTLNLSHFGICADDECYVEPPEEIVETPLPAAVWLFGSALLGLTSFGRRKVA